MTTTSSEAKPDVRLIAIEFTGNNWEQIYEWSNGRVTPFPLAVGSWVILADDGRVFSSPAEHFSKVLDKRSGGIDIISFGGTNEATLDTHH